MGKRRAAENREQKFIKMGPIGKEVPMNQKGGLTERAVNGKLSQ